MISASSNEFARPCAADDVEPLWHVRFPSGLVTMTLDELDAAFQGGSISAQTLVAREDDSQLRPLGVVAGLFEQEHGDVPRPEAPYRRDISGVRPAAPAQQQLSESSAASASCWTLLADMDHGEPSLEQAMVGFESAPLRWLRQARATSRQVAGRARTWFAARAPGQRWAIGAALAAGLAAVCVVWSAQRRPPAAVVGADPAARARAPLALTAALTSARPAGGAAPSQQLATAPAGPSSIPSLAGEPRTELAVPIAREPAHHRGTFAERPPAGRAEGSRRASRRARAAKRRASRE